MDQKQNLRACPEGIIFEVIGQEIVVISLATGTYFSLKSPASTIFALLESGCHRSDLPAKLNDLYSAPENLNVEQIESFVDQLMSESIMEYCKSNDGKGFDQGTIQSLAVPPYQTPVIDKFEDMQDLFLLDPVHPVVSTESTKKTEEHANQ
ncbi:MAG: hypothetical protein SGJ27_06470 [Candidatus Melainabacteria bacterium]|nr:hypothetical protein [Candidatus Melainabacteria bacterium]